MIETINEKHEDREEDQACPYNPEDEHAYILVREFTRIEHEVSVLPCRCGSGNYGLAAVKTTSIHVDCFEEGGFQGERFVSDWGDDYGECHREENTSVFCTACYQWATREDWQDSEIPEALQIDDEEVEERFHAYCMDCHLRFYSEEVVQSLMPDTLS